MATLTQRYQIGVGIIGLVLVFMVNFEAVVLRARVAARPASVAVAQANLVSLPFVELGRVGRDSTLPHEMFFEPSELGSLGAFAAAKCSRHYGGRPTPDDLSTVVTGYIYAIPGRCADFLVGALKCSFADYGAKCARIFSKLRILARKGYGTLEARSLTHALLYGAG